MAEILIYLVPKKYRSIGHGFVGFGGFFIIFIMIYIFNYINILGQCCLIIGLSGIYFSKTKNFRSVRKSEEKEGIEQKYSNGINGKALPPKYVYIFYVITIIGVVFSFYYLFLLFTSILQGDSFFISLMLPYPMMLLIGDLLLIGGLLILYFKKRKASWYRLENLPMKYRLSKRLKCKDCGNKFKSKIMQCPNCNGKDIKILWHSR